MPLYESVFIARQDASPGQVESLAAGMADIIKNLGGQVTKTEQWGLRQLAYKINKNRKGHYVLMNIDAPSAAVVEMERNLGINEDVLRYMTIKVEKLEEGPSAIVSNKGGDRPEGGRFDRGDRPEGGRFGGDRGGERFDRGGDRPRRFETSGEA